MLLHSQLCNYNFLLSLKSKSSINIFYQKINDKIIVFQIFMFKKIENISRVIAHQQNRVLSSTEQISLRIAQYSINLNII
jgi:hypothetical protein